MTAAARRPFIAVAIYLTLVAIALAVGLSKACCGEQGILATILTLPWSIATVTALDAINPDLIDRVGAVALVPGALVNAAVLYRVMRSRSRRVHGRRAEAPKPPAP